MMIEHIVYSDGEMRVCEEKCGTCIFRPLEIWDREMSKRMAEEALNMGGDGLGGMIPCHETYDEGQSLQAICRGFWDVYRNESIILTMAENMGIVRYVDPAELS